MNGNYIRVNVDFTTEWDNPFGKEKETKEFHEAINRAFPRFVEEIQRISPGQWPVLANGLFLTLKDLRSYKTETVKEDTIPQENVVQWIITNLYEILIEENLKDRIINYQRQFNSLPAIGQVITLYDYESKIHSIIQKYIPAWKSSSNSLEWILMEHNFIIALINYFDPDNSEDGNQNGRLEFYFKLHFSY